MAFEFKGQQNVGLVSTPADQDVHTR